MKKAHSVARLRRVAVSNRRLSPGNVSRIDAEGFVWVVVEGGSAEPVKARILATVAQSQSLFAGAEVLLACEDDPSSPIVCGAVLDRIRPDRVVIDGKTVTLDAKDEVRISCGKSSIVLSKDGRVIVKGVEIVTRGMRANKIRGGTVQIN